MPECVFDTRASAPRAHWLVTRTKVQSVLRTTVHRSYSSTKKTASEKTNRKKKHQCSPRSPGQLCSWCPPQLEQTTTLTSNVALARRGHSDDTKPTPDTPDSHTPPGTRPPVCFRLLLPTTDRLNHVLHKTTRLPKPSYSATKAVHFDISPTFLGSFCSSFAYESIGPMKHAFSLLFRKIACCYSTSSVNPCIKDIWTLTLFEITS